MIHTGSGGPALLLQQNPAFYDGNKKGTRVKSVMQFQFETNENVAYWCHLGVIHKCTTNVKYIIFITNYRDKVT